LSDGSNTYLYGLDRIAQQNIVGRQYYLGDALGSVRQLTNAVGSVTLARSYEPFGKLLSTAGNPLTKYGYTGEWTDPTNLVYLRARYYDPATGRFLTKDPVRGLISLPITQNNYIYALNNPILLTDPTGRFCSAEGGNKSEICPGAVAGGALLIIALAPIDFALVIANVEMVSIPIIGPIVEALILVPVDLIVIDLHFVAASIMVQGSYKPCDSIEVELLPPWGFEK
jgi:RHS repeat-associated protein